MTTNNKVVVKIRDEVNEMQYLVLEHSLSGDDYSYFCVIKYNMFTFIILWLGPFNISHIEKLHRCGKIIVIGIIKDHYILLGKQDV